MNKITTPFIIKSLVPVFTILLLSAQLTTAQCISATFATTPGYCGGLGTATLSGTTGGSGSYDYSWSNGGPQSSISGFSGNYSVTVSDAEHSTCTGVFSGSIGTASETIVARDTITPAWCGGLGSAVLNYVSGGSGDYSYAWSNDETTAGISGPAGEYSVTITDVNHTFCTTVFTATIDTATAKITAGGPTTFCSGDSVRLTASAGLSFLWSTSATTQSIEATASGDYVVTITGPGGCSEVSKATVIKVNPLPTATITASGATTFCAGDSVTLIAKAGTGYTYKWSTAATTDSITVSTSGSYVVTVSTNKGCTKASTAKKVTVDPLPKATITASGSTVLCNNDTILLVANSGTGLGYNWSTGATTQSIVVFTTGSYKVTVTNANGCTKASAATKVTECDEDVAGKDNNSTNSNNTGALNPEVSGNGGLDVSVYPNPYSGEFHLKVSGSSTENIIVNIYDINGRLLNEKAGIVYGTDVVFGNSYAAGVYIVQVKQGAATKVVRVVKSE